MFAFGQTNASNNPSAPKPIGFTTPFGSQTGSSFGAAQSSSSISSNTTFGASSSPAFPFGPGPTFGSSSSPAFGTSSSLFGVGDGASSEKVPETPLNQQTEEVLQKQPTVQPATQPEQVREEPSEEVQPANNEASTVTPPVPKFRNPLNPTHRMERRRMELLEEKLLKLQTDVSELRKDVAEMKIHLVQESNKQQNFMEQILSKLDSFTGKFAAYDEWWTEKYENVIIPEDTEKRPRPF